MPYRLKTVVASLLRELREGVALFESRRLAWDESEGNDNAPRRRFPGRPPHLLQPTEVECALRIAVVDHEPREPFPPEEVDTLRRAIAPIVRDFSSRVVEGLVEQVESRVAGLDIAPAIVEALEVHLASRLTGLYVDSLAEGNRLSSSVHQDLSSWLLMDAENAASPIEAAFSSLGDSFDEQLGDPNAQAEERARQLRQRNELINQLLEKAPRPASLVALAPGLPEGVNSTLQSLVTPFMAEVDDCLNRAGSEFRASTIWVEVGADRLAKMPGAVSTLHLAAQFPAPKETQTTITPVWSGERQRSPG